MWLKKKLFLVLVLVLISFSAHNCQTIEEEGDSNVEADESKIDANVQNSELNAEDEHKTSVADGSPEDLLDHDPSPADPVDSADPVQHQESPVEETPAVAGQKPTMDSKSGKLVYERYDYTNYDSLKARYVPPLQSQRGGEVYILTEARLEEIRSQFMYWYFDQGGVDDVGDWQKAIQVSSPQLHKNLNFQLPFFGFRFNYTRISMHGMLEFSDPPENYPSYPLVFPNKDWPKKNDPSFIGIWLSKCRIGMVGHEDMDQRRAGVYFRMERDLTTRVDRFGVEVRERLKWDIREGVIGSETFDPKHAIFVTWKNMSFNGGYGPALSRTNTFQLVLATDEVFTYAMFNYLDLQWTSHTEAGGDSLNGEGGVPAYVGFNAGNGTQSYEYLPYSQNSVIRDLSGRGYANGFKGRHIFRIDEKIILGTCNKDVDGANLDLIFAPESGNMLGGTIVNITGPCFEPNDKIICRFDTEEVYGTVVDSNRALCVQPFIYAEGYIRFEVAIGNGNYKWKGKFFIETPATAAEKIFFADNAVHERSPREVRITWEKYNLTTNQNAPLRISLYGYRETTIRPEFIFISQLADGVTNTGAHTIVPGEYRNRDDYLVNDLAFGFIQINLTQTINVNGMEVTPMIWSKPIPLGWYFGAQWEKLYGTNWPDEMCNIWIKNDRYLKNFANELPQCPCSLAHALIDKGRYQPDYDCDKDANPKCQYHKGALHCVRTGAATLEGSEQQCCYDKNGYLMLTYDQQWGSRPHRSHNLGYLPWNEANKVPTLSHWFHDMVPLYLCCSWQEEQSVGCETFRFERRPTQDCVAYQSPQIATVFGDPHVVTFDDLEYTFNGKGEFALVSVNDKTQRLDVQGRFEQLNNNAYGEVRATQLTSIATRGNSSTVVEVRLRPKEAQWRYRLDVFADGKRLYFDRPSLKFQGFSGVTIYTPTYILNQSEVIIMYDSGAGVEIVENEGFMTCRVYLPWTFINKTRGLFGNWSFDIIDDYTLPDGTLSPVSSNVNDFENVHNSFGIEWMLEDKEIKKKPAAMFYREFGRTSSYYNNKSFIPEFKIKPEDILPPNRSIDIQRAYDLCSEYYQCRYDYSLSLDRDLSHFTKNYHSTVINMKTINQNRIISCGVLETPRFGRKSNFLFVPGTKVTFECNQDFILVGDQRRTCLPEGRWDVPEYGYTECLRDQEYSSRNAGITFGIILAVLVPILLVLIYVAYKFIQKRNANDEGVQLTPEARMAMEDARKRMASIDDDDDNSFTYSKDTRIN